jgi:hypothetical protein
MSKGEVCEAATTEPAVGMWVLPAFPRELIRSISTVEKSDAIFVNDLPSANSINLQINPPDAWNPDDAPEICFAQESSRRGPLDEGEPDETGENQEGYAKEEEELEMC